MLKTNNILLFLIFMVIIIIIIEFVKLNTLTKCPKPIIEYKYVPRTFKEEQDEPVFIQDIFYNMFNKSSPWMLSRNIGISDKRQLS
jgi:hypothetical protein